MNAKTLRIMPCLVLLACCLGTPAVSGFYDPSIQRWVNRDPIGESGGINVYEFALNQPIGNIDSDGRQAIGVPSRNPPSDSKVRLCNRKIENETYDWVIGIANARGHDYFDWPADKGGRDGIGFRDENGKDGDLPTSEAGSQARNCRQCYKSGKPIKYGSGVGKPWRAVTDEDIKDCLRKRPIKGDYHGTQNNCNDWARGAAEECGIVCP
jgi:uncharacterized protein RhaS with RHS repeats